MGLLLLRLYRSPAGNTAALSVVAVGIGLIAAKRKLVAAADVGSAICRLAAKAGMNSTQWPVLVTRMLPGKAPRNSRVSRATVDWASLASSERSTVFAKPTEESLINCTVPIDKVPSSTMTTTSSINVKP